MATLLDVTAALLQELDYHFSGDSLLADEDTWTAEARTRLLATINSFLEGQQ
jgi:hypothetical protein